jgi:two-component sensor histidine kinase
MQEITVPECRGKAERLLLDELTHRMNNELAGAIGIVWMAETGADAPVTAVPLKRVRVQLQNFADIHHLLRPPEWSAMIDAAVFLRTLCRALSVSRLWPRGIDLELIERPLQIDSVQCWRLAVILYELISNSCRHRYGDETGQIRVEVSRNGPDVEARVQDTSRRNGGVVRRGRGLDLVEAFVNELQGRIDQRFCEEGCITTLVFPARGSVVRGG